MILFSGVADGGGTLKTAEDRVQRFEILSKPVHPEALLKAVERMFDSDAGREMEVSVPPSDA